jgi:fluoride exporter
MINQPLPAMKRKGHRKMEKLLWVMLGGSLGAAGRYGISLVTINLWGTRFPWGTWIVNLTGCFLIGLLFGLSDRVRLLTPEMRLLLITGFLGALTTFSAFSMETVSAGQAGMRFLAIMNILVNNLVGLALTVLGLWLGSVK